MGELISIVTTLHNYAEYVPELAKSVFKQDWDNWEWIVVDDASVDRPERALKPWWKKKCFRYIRLDRNQGYSVAKNVGILASRGDYIVMIDADDTLTPASLRLRYEALAPTKKLWCHGECLVLHMNKGTRKMELSEESRRWKRKFRKQLQEEGMNLKETYHHRLVHAQSVMVRKEIHRQLGLYDENIRCSADNEMWRRFIAFGHVPVHIEDFVAIYRVHGRRMSRSAYKRKHRHAIKRYVIDAVEQRTKEGITAKNTRLLK